jgi:hypothetical protein
MQTFNHFFVATALLAAAYAALLEKSPAAATGVASVGTWIAFWFTRLDRRVSQLIKAGEAALEVVEARLAEAAEIESLNIVEHVQRAERGASRYSTVIALLEWSVVVAFASATTYAYILAIGSAATCP